MDNTPKTPRWNPWPVSIIAFFTVALIGCGSFVAFCSRHPADLVAADYYEQELRYQRRLESIQRARQNARLVSVTYDPAGKRIRVCLPPSQSPARAAGQIQLYRPSAAGLDRQLKLAPGADGVQSIDAASLAPGLWKVRVSWTVDRQEYFIDQKVVIHSKPS